MRVRSYAKVNLWLRVVGTRPDGYHDIETVFHAVSLSDFVTLEVAPLIDVRMQPRVVDNLASRAARLLAERASRPVGAAITIEKTIPIGAGLAGGSGNAAAVLLGLNSLWKLDLDDETLHDIALELGSDVPFFTLQGGTALGQGRGERLTPLPSMRLKLWFVLGISSRELSTAEVYGEWKPAAAKGSSLDDFRFALDTGEPGLIAPAIRNDLEEPALLLRPDLADKKSKLLDAGALGAFISGSGPTVVGLARDKEHAEAVARAVSVAFDRVEVARSHPSGVELGR